MAVYYKFKSARDYDSIAIDGPFISVLTLKERIFESKHLGRGTDLDLLLTNAQTNEEYSDDAMLIRKNASVLVRRVPGLPRMPIVIEKEPKKIGFQGTDSSAMKYTEDTERDEFGNDFYAIPDAPPVHSSNPLPSKAEEDEDSKIKALINTPALDWQRQSSDRFALGRKMGGRGFGLERHTPPQGYVCHRCKVPGHFIKHCPTNGDPKYDIKIFKYPSGIPKSMLIQNPDGSYALPSGEAAFLRPNEAAFQKEIEGLSSTRSIGDLPSELHCPLCKEVMKDGVLTSKCCFNSFCDKCIRDYIISKAMCLCGATNILADDLLPNKTLRDTINRLLKSVNSSAENAGSAFQVQDIESARCPPQPKVPSPIKSAASKGDQKPSPRDRETPIAKEIIDEGKAVIGTQQCVKKVQPVEKATDVSESTLESVSVKESNLQQEVKQMMASEETGKKKKKVCIPANDLQWQTLQDLPVESYMMRLGPSTYNPYWTGSQPGMEYMSPYMGYGMGPLNMPFGSAMPQDPLASQGYMMPVVPPQRRLAEFGMGMNNVPPHIMRREEFETQKADLWRQHQNERRGDREFSRDREYCREVSSRSDVSSVKSKSKSVTRASSTDHYYHHHLHQSARSPLEPLPAPSRPSKRKSDHGDRDYDYYYDRERGRHRNHHRTESSSKPSSEPTTSTRSNSTMSTTLTAADKKYNRRVFCHTSFHEEEATAITSKKRKMSSSAAAVGCASAAEHHKASSNCYYKDYKSSSSAKARVELHVG